MMKKWELPLIKRVERKELKNIIGDSAELEINKYLDSEAYMLGYIMYFDHESRTVENTTNLFGLMPHVVKLERPDDCTIILYDGFGNSAFIEIWDIEE